MGGFFLSLLSFLVIIHFSILSLQLYPSVVNRSPIMAFYLFVPVLTAILG